MRPHTHILRVVHALLLCFTAVGFAKPSTSAEDAFRPLPASIAVDTRRAALGARLFQDPMLSRDGRHACASCHRLDRHGVDRRRKSSGHGDTTGGFNTPSVLNAVFSSRLFWDGRGDSLELQGDNPSLLPLDGEAGARVMARLRTAPAYLAAFQALYPEGITPVTVRQSLVEYLRTLITPSSRFDRYLRGDLHALNEQERSGLETFKRVGCVSCHQGVALGGNMFQRMGLFADYFAERGSVTAEDLGRFNHTNQATDRFVFRVPGLRNVAETAPYFHDGSVDSLEAAVHAMGHYQLGRALTAAEVADLVSFLKTLSAPPSSTPR